eukprot:347701-Chlamydomonas_euryale.AAC.14
MRAGVQYRRAGSSTSGSRFRCSISCSLKHRALPLTQLWAYTPSARLCPGTSGTSLTWHLT